MSTSPSLTPSQLYLDLCSPQYQTNSFQIEDLGEQMALMKELVSGYWRLRYLLDHERQEAVEIVDASQQLTTVTEDDIDWESMKKLPSKVAARAYYRLCLYPFFILNYHNGIAEAIWMINPEGRYFADSDGYGMTGDQEINLRGAIDRSGKVVERFRYIEE